MTVQIRPAPPNIFMEIRAEYIRDGNAITQFRDEIIAAPVISIDAETTGFDPHSKNIRLVQVATSPQRGFIFDLYHVKPSELAWLGAKIADPNTTKLFQNGKFDMKFFMTKFGWQHFPTIYDTYLASVLIACGDDSVRHGLGNLAENYLGMELDKQYGASNWDEPELSRDQLAYAIRDACLLFPIQEKQNVFLDKLDLRRVAMLEFDCVEAVAALELKGIYLNREHWQERLDRQALRKTGLEKKTAEHFKDVCPVSLFGEVDVDLDSPVKLLPLLKKLGVPLTGGTMEDELKPFVDQFPVVKDLLDYREMATALKMFGPDYLDFINPADQRIHADFRQIGTPTGRFTCSKPNLQQVTSEEQYRSSFQAQGEFRSLVIADYCLTGDTRILTIEGPEAIADLVLNPKPVLSVGAGQCLEFRPLEATSFIGFIETFLIELEDGTSVRCTGDHEWVNRKGVKVKTKNLSIGDRLEHVRECVNGGPGVYPTWSLRGMEGHGYVYKHIIAAKYALGPKPAGFDVDHKDFDIENWRASNLRYLPIKENRAQGGKRAWAKRTDEGKKKRIADMVAGLKQNRRPYDGEGNPNYGKKKGKVKTCPTCQKQFYRPPSLEAIYCSRACYFGNNHRVVNITTSGVQPVYHVTVEENHNFVLENGLVSGNSMIELRIMAEFSQDEKMLEAFQNDIDLHQFTGSQAFGLPLEAALKGSKKGGTDQTDAQRQIGKMLNFGTGYGAAAPRFAAISGLPVKKAGEALAFFWGLYNGLDKYMKDCEARAVEENETHSYSGRTWRLDYDPTDRNSIGAVQRIGRNFPIQATCSDIMKRAMYFMRNETRDRDIDLVNIVHDEAVHENDDTLIEEASQIINDCMVAAAEEVLTRVPTKVDVNVSKVWKK